MNFQSKLAARTRAAEIPDNADTYGWLIGSWELDVRTFRGVAVAERTRGEAHFAWILEGRAVQDVWIMPGLYGTTLRVWEPSIQAWRVTWINPGTGTRDELIGRLSGGEVVQTGTHSDGAAIRWIFSAITRDAFRWTGECLNPDGATWVLEAEFMATRMR